MRSVLTPSIRPSYGASLIIVPGVSGVVVPANTTNPVVDNFQWPFACKIVRAMLLPRSGAKADLAALTLRIYDEDSELATDGFGVSALANFCDGLQHSGIVPSGAVFSLTGWTWSPAWRRFGRVVRAGERWNFQVANNGAVDVTPILAFELETLVEVAA